ncbi:hypothetical protein ACE6H2_027055 [Prunus campanulata]
MVSSTHSLRLCPDPRSQPPATDYGSALCMGGLSTTILRSKQWFVWLLVTHLWRLWICDGGEARGKWRL